MAKSVLLTTLGLGSNPSALAGLVPDNPLINTIGGLVTDLLSLRSTPTSIVLRYPAAGSGELRRVYLLDGEAGGFDDVTTDLKALSTGGVHLALFEAENTPQAGKLYTGVSIAIAATLSGVGLGAVDSEARAMQETILLPVRPRLTLSQVLNRLEDIILVSNDMPHFVSISQLSQTVTVGRGAALTQVGVEATFAPAMTLVAAVSMENYIPPSSSIDKHFFESGAVLG